MKNKCVDCNKEISRYAKRCRSCSKKGHKQTEEAKEKIRVGNIGKHNHYSGENNPNFGKHRPCYEETKEKIRISMIGKNKGEKSGRFGKASWNKNLTKETDERVAKLSQPRSDKTKEKMSISHLGIIPWNKNKKLGPYSDEHKRKIGKSKIGNKNTLGHHWKLSEETKQKASTPKRIQQALQNGFGNNCYYDNEFFPSNAERNCYIKLKELGVKVKHNFENRFDFLVEDKIVLEYHPYDITGLPDDLYYEDRRKLLDEYGYKNLKLIVIKDLKEIENKLILEGGLNDVSL